MYAGCTSYTDRTQDGATLNLNFSNLALGLACLRVSTTQTLAFTGISSFHPMGQYCGPAQRIPTPSESAVTLMNLPPGSYGFYCPNHGIAQTGQNMGLAIQVVP